MYSTRVSKSYLAQCLHSKFGLILAGYPAGQGFYPLLSGMLIAKARGAPM